MPLGVADTGSAMPDLDEKTSSDEKPISPAGLVLAKAQAVPLPVLRGESSHLFRAAGRRREHAL
jgi:hypothetical protein